MTKDRGHTSRNKTASFRITKDDLLSLEDIAEINRLSTKETLRLVIIWMAIGIKDEKIDKSFNNKAIKDRRDSNLNIWLASGILSHCHVK